MCLFLFLPNLAGAAYVVKPFATPSGFVVYALQFIVEKAKAAEMSQEDAIKNFITFIAELENADSEHYIKLAGCESGYDTDILGDKGKSKGLYQWQERSWAHYNKVFNTHYDRELWQDQTRLTIKVGEKYGTKRDWYNCTQFIKYGTWNKEFWK